MFATAFRERRSPPLPAPDIPGVKSAPAVKALPPSEATAVRNTFAGRRQRAARRAIAAIEDLREAAHELKQTRADIYAAGAGLVPKIQPLPDKQVLAVVEKGCRAILETPEE